MQKVASKASAAVLQRDRRGTGRQRARRAEARRARVRLKNGTLTRPIARDPRWAIWRNDCHVDGRLRVVVEQKNHRLQ